MLIAFVAFAEDSCSVPSTSSIKVPLVPRDLTPSLTSLGTRHMLGAHTCRQVKHTFWKAGQFNLTTCIESVETRSRKLVDLIGEGRQGRGKYRKEVRGDASVYKVFCLLITFMISSCLLVFFLET